MIMKFGRKSFLTWPKGLKERIQKETQMRNYRGLTKEGKMVYGWFLKTHNPTTEDTHWIIKDGLYATDIIIGIDNTKFPKMLQGCYPVIPETVGQSIGLKDKNGTEEKEVYQSDIITYQHPVALTKWTAIVIWNEKWFQWALQDKETKEVSPLVILEGYNWKIIGNIFQHPKIMEQDNDPKNP